MKTIMIALLALMLTACVSLDTYNAKAWKPNRTGASVIFENDKGVAVQEENKSITPYVYYVGESPGPQAADDWFFYNFKTQGVDEREAKALKFLGVALAGDIVSSQIGFSRGCVEKNILAKGIGPAGMTAYSLGNFGLYYIGAYSSTIYQSTLKKDTRHIYGGAAFKGALTIKNLMTKC